MAITICTEREEFNGGSFGQTGSYLKIEASNPRVVASWSVKDP